MNVYERQLRQGIAALMAPATSLAQRTAQTNGLHALLNLHDVATLLAIIDETRRDAISVLNFVVEQTSPDNPAWARAAEHSQHLFELAQEAGATCEDEGCPHYGAPHAHPVPASAAQLPPIPSGVYYSNGNFYETATRKGMGHDYARRWADRASEFPREPAPSYNDASKREPRPGTPGYNDGTKREYPT